MLDAAWPAFPASLPRALGLTDSVSQQQMTALAQLVACCLDAAGSADEAAAAGSSVAAVSGLGFCQSRHCSWPPRPAVSMPAVCLQCTEALLPVVHA